MTANKSENLIDCYANTDIYLIDQIQKGRYHKGDSILDAGCGNGRNMHWFYWNDFDIHGIDLDIERVTNCIDLYPEIMSNIVTGSVENMPYQDQTFDHVISSAVLHFAQHHNHFHAMMSEMLRVLKVGGTIWIRMTTDIGIKGQKSTGDGTFDLLDDTKRYLLTNKTYQGLLEKHSLTPLESFKSVVVDEVRSMGVLLLQKTC